MMGVDKKEVKMKFQIMPRRVQGALCPDLIDEARSERHSVCWGEVGVVVCL
jgi:hypothetical protein